MPAEAARRGSLLAVGGREAREGEMLVLERFVRICGGPDASLVVVTAASSNPESRVAEYGGALQALGCTDVAFHHQAVRADASEPKLLEALERADGVFFTGGNQLKLVTILAGSPAEELLRTRYQAGLHIGGTSAGAAAMSAVMIARGKPRQAPRLSSIRMTPGLGLLRDVIIDQHFRERDRYGRLMAAVLSNPAMLGFGLDENTAFELDADGRVSVFGNGAVTIFDGAEIEGTNIDVVPEGRPAAFSGMRVHVLTEDWCFDLATRCVERPAVEPNSRKAVG